MVAVIVVVYTPCHADACVQLVARYCTGKEMMSADTPFAGSVPLTYVLDEAVNTLDLNPSTGA